MKFSLIASLGLSATLGSLLAAMTSSYVEWTTTPTSAAAPPPPASEPGRHEAQVESTRQVVPGTGLPEGVHLHASNDALDAIRFRGRTYLAFRSSPTRHPNANTSVYVVSSSDEHTWKLEQELFLATELQAPRWLPLNDRLFLYVSKLSPTRYETLPLGVVATSTDGTGAWSPLRTLALGPVIAWRTRVEGDLPLMSTFAPRKTPYALSDRSSEVRLLTTSDGIEWEPLLAGGSAVVHGGGREAVFSSDDDGSLFAVVRNDASDASGYGSSVCFAAANNWSDWDCVNDNRRYESPGMFTYDGEIYLIGLRDLTSDGAYDRGVGVGLLRTLFNEVDHASSAKRCALWRYIRNEHRLGFLMDLPSRGDTCSAAVLPDRDPGRFVIYVHSSDLAGPDVPLHVGQRRPTGIYRHVVHLARRLAPEEAVFSSGR